MKMTSSGQEVIWKTCITTRFGHVNTCLETAFRYHFKFRVSSNLETVSSGSISASGLGAHVYYGSAYWGTSHCDTITGQLLSLVRLKSRAPAWYWGTMRARRSFVFNCQGSVSSLQLFLLEVRCCTWDSLLEPRAGMTRRCTVRVGLGENNSFCFDISAQEDP